MWKLTNLSQPESPFFNGLNIFVLPVRKVQHDTEVKKNCSNFSDIDNRGWKQGYFTCRCINIWLIHSFDFDWSSPSFSIGIFARHKRNEISILKLQISWAFFPYHQHRYCDFSNYRGCWYRKVISRSSTLEKMLSFVFELFFDVSILLILLWY